MFNTDEQHRPLPLVAAGPDDVEPAPIGVDGASLESRTPQVGRRAWLPFLLIILLAVGVRIYSLSGQSLGLDEADTVVTASAPALKDVVGPAPGYPEPPLYATVLYLWMKIGQSDAHIRLLSVALGVLGVAAVFLLYRDLWSRQVGLTAALLLAVNPLHVWYSQEARMYSLLFLGLVCSTLLLFRAVTRSSRRAWIAYGVALGISGLTHVIAALFVCAQASFVALHPRRRVLLRPFFMTLLAVGIVLSPVMYNYISMRADRPIVQIDKPFTWLNGPYLVFAQSVGLSFGPSIYELQRDASLDTLRAYVPGIGGVALLFGAPFLLGSLIASRDRSEGRGPQLVLLTFMVPLAGGLLLDATTGLTVNPRYTMGNLAAYVGLLAAGIHALGRRGGLALLGALVVVSTASLWNYFHNPRYGREDARSAAHYIRQTVDPLTPIVVLSYAPSIERYAPELRVLGAKVLGLPSFDDVEGRLRALSATAASFVLVDLRAWHWDPDGRVEATCDRLFEQKLETRFHGVRVLTYRVAPSRDRSSSGQTTGAAEPTRGTRP